MDELPKTVIAAMARADAARFAYSCDDDAGRLLATLSAAVPPGGRILELGTGVGVGTAWIVHGVGARTDVTAVSVEVDPSIATVAKSASWPDWLRVEVDDAEQALRRLVLCPRTLPGSRRPSFPLAAPPKRPSTPSTSGIPAARPAETWIRR
ncbi:MAG TPA: hypothetical protein VM677_23430 [Actinokineospora sp.]|nr:hypothetical protein [Actinokineospora sp.]